MSAVTRTSPAALTTVHLALVPCTSALARSALGDGAGLERATGARPASGWPSDAARSWLAAFTVAFDRDPAILGWGPWLVVAESAVVGDAGFKGPPRDGVVEIGYGVAPGWRRRGIATEAARALVDWAARSRSVACILAECEPDNSASIGVLRRLGMVHAAPGRGGLLRWESWTAR